MLSKIRAQTLSHLMKRIITFAFFLLIVSLAIVAAQNSGTTVSRLYTIASETIQKPLTAIATQVRQANTKRREQKILDNFDIRAGLKRSLAAPPEKTRTTDSKQFGVSEASAEAAEQLLNEKPRTMIRWSSLTGTPSRIVNFEQSLTNGRGDDSRWDAEDAARNFLREKRGLFRLREDEVQNLRVARKTKTEHNGLTHLTLEQNVGGIEIFQGKIAVHVDRSGSVIATTGELMPEADRIVNLTQPHITSAEALRLAAGFAETELKAAPVAQSVEGTSEQHQKFDQSIGFARDPEGRLVYFPISASSLRLAWEFTLWMKDSPDAYLIVVDAERGSLLYRFNFTTYEDNPLNPHGMVYMGDSPRQGLPYVGNDNPASIDRLDVPFHATAFNGTTIFGVNDKHYDWWAGLTANGLISNNADAHLDRSPADNIADTPRLTALDGNFTFPLDFTLDPTTDNNQKAAQVNLFYWVNRYHDILYSFGFTESAGNFQTNNFGLGGSGNDAIQADVQDGTGTNNANFSTPPDGRAGRVQMYLWTGSPMLDGDFDQGVIIHELTHGLSNRLVGNATGLVGLQAQGMGEGWSDFIGLALLRKESDDVDGSYPVGQYVRNNYAKGIRRYPYSTNINVNPLTYSQIAINPEVHRIGEIWCSALWEMRALLIKKYGFNEGQRQSIQLVVDGLKLTPNAPTFLDARDAILLADRVNNNGANQCLLWQAFAKRGMGYTASSDGVDDPAPVESFDTPPYCNDTGSVSLDKTNYLIGEAMRISVGDRNATNPVKVQITSTVTGDNETLTLTPDTIYAGVFNGTMRVASGLATRGDGALQASIEAGDTIKVTYVDANPASNIAVESVATAGIVREKTLFEDQVENGNQGWIANGGWAITSQRSASPSRSWTDSANGSYSNNSSATLTSPAFDCRNLSNVTLSFSHSYEFESGFDFGIVETSVDDGATWTRAASFTSQALNFGLASINLDTLNNQAAGRIRFRIQSDASVTADGWYIDDIRLTGRSSNPAVIKPGNPNAPVINSVTPAFGSPAGGTQIQIIGANFTDSTDTTVMFDGIAAKAISVVSSSVIKVTTPAQSKAKAVSLRVANRYGEITLSQGFTYYNAGTAMSAPLIGNVFPNSGSTRGGTPVTIVGANFTPETTLTFGSLQAVTTYVNPNTLIALSPVVGAASTVDVTVNNAGQTAKLSGAFNYYAPTPPTVKVLSPQGGETLFINQTVTIRWNSSDNRVLSRHRVALYRNVTGSMAQVIDIADLPGEVQSVNWTVPATIGQMNNARIRVLAIDDEGAETEAYSSSDFTITRRWENQTTMTTALQRLAVASDGSNLYAIGGRLTSSSASIVDTVSRFNPASNSWTSTGLAKMPVGFSSHDAAFLNGRIYVPGGMTNGALSASHYVYDIAANSWAAQSDVPAVTYSYALAADAQRSVLYLTGGIGGAGVATTIARTFNPQTNAWADLPIMKNARYGHRAAVIDGKLFVIGGYGVSGGLLNNEVFDFASQKWSAIANLNRPRAFAASAVVQDANGNPYLLLVGGEDPNTRAILQSADVYDVRRNVWFALDNSFNLNTARTQLTGAVLNGYFYAVGGGTVSATSPVSNASIERLNVQNFAASSDGQPPALAVPATQIAIAGRELEFEVVANDLNSSNPLILSADGLPASANFTTSNSGNNNARGMLRWTPNDADNGKSFVVSFTATDGQFSEIKNVTIKVVTASPLAVVNAASYSLGAIPADSIATAFGTNLAVRSETAQSLPLPTELSGTTLTINGIPAQLLYVSPTQINFVVPSTVAAGTATVIVSNPTGSYALGTTQITNASPSIFSADSTGRGDAAAVATADGINYETGPFSVSINGRQNILLLFGTGFRHAQASNPGDENGVAEAVKVTIDGQEARVLYAGSQHQFIGLDQLNVEMPGNLQPGTRRAEVVVYLNGVEANRVTIPLK